MRLGVLPSQQRAIQQAFKKARKFDDFRGRTRRGLLVAAAMGGVSTLAAFLVGRSQTRAANVVSPPDLTALRQLATGPIETLRAAYPTFLLQFERDTEDQVLWIGYARLVDVARQTEDRKLARHLYESWREPPAAMRPLTDQLQSLLAGR